MTLPNGYQIKDDPVYHASEDCMGNKTNYWSQSATGLNQQVLRGYGISPKEAYLDVVEKCREDARFNYLPARDRIIETIAKIKERKPMHVYDNELALLLIDICTVVGIQS